MNLGNRFQLALESQIGTIFIGLLLFLLILAAAYLLLRRRQRERDLLAYLFSAHYEKAKNRAPALQFIGLPKADFFGQQTIVKVSNGALGVCLIPPPDLSDDTIRERYRLFYRAVQSRTVPMIAPHLWKWDEDIWLIVQGKLLHSDGRLLLNLKHYVKEIDKEKILLEIATSLNALHEMHTETGEKLYHGFLLPSSFYLDFGADKTLKRITLADAGMAFSIGAEKMYQRLALLRGEKQAPMEKYRIHELLEQISILAPEQRDLRYLDRVGPPSDFYSFAALAVYLFTNKTIYDPKLILWNKIPERWHVFLKTCLQINPEKRPKTFSELTDWLSDPEMALTQIDSAELKHHFKVDDAELFNEGKYEDLPKMLNRLREKSTQKNPAAEKFAEHFDLGLKAIKTSKWIMAKKHFRDALKIDPMHAEAHTQCAIACYELKDLKDAEQHYEVAKKQDSRVAKKFREHIALHI